MSLRRGSQHRNLPHYRKAAVNKKQLDQSILSITERSVIGTQMRDANDPPRVEARIILRAASPAQAAGAEGRR